MHSFKLFGSLNPIQEHLPHEDLDLQGHSAPPDFLCQLAANPTIGQKFVQKTSGKGF
jgi:hypothetical protein